MRLVVLGRCWYGTSVLTGLLHFIWAYVGLEALSIGANDANPKRFWKRWNIRNLNDSLLSSVGCDWSSIGKLSLEQLNQKTIDELAKSAAGIVAERDNHGSRVIKEPRATGQELQSRPAKPHQESVERPKQIQAPKGYCSKEREEEQEDSRVF